MANTPTHFQISMPLKPCMQLKSRDVDSRKAGSRIAIVSHINPFKQQRSPTTGPQDENVKHVGRWALTPSIYPFKHQNISTTGPHEKKVTDIPTVGRCTLTPVFRPDDFTTEFKIGKRPKNL